MALQASGNPISFSQISNEFGLPPSRNLGAYRISQTVGTLSNLPLDTGIPQSGTIRFSNFYSKRLNVVVDFHSITNNSTRLIIRSRYNQTGGVNVVGGLKSDLPADGAGKRIIANVNKRIGSEKTGRNYCALRTGAWGTDVNLEIVIGSSGELIGAGGNGGAGGGINGGSAGGGGTGSSALGLQYPTRVINGGNIISGKGGGGGGAGAYGQEVNSQRRCRTDQTQPRIGGAGGAGGRGLPAGGGGSANEQWSRLSNKQAGSRTFATAGTAGSVLSSGGGGSSGVIVPQDNFSCANRQAISGAGGGSGSSGANGRRTRPGVDEIANASSPGGGGTNGYAIIESTAGNLISFTGTAVNGNNVTSTVQ
jgi:hypothetical protein